MLKMVAMTLALLPAVCSTLLAQTVPYELGPEESKWRGPLAAGGVVKIQGGLGDITIVESDRNEVELEISRGSEGSVKPRVVIANNAKGLVVCGDWVTAAGTASPCATTKRMLTNRSLKDYASLDLRLSVPRGVEVDAHAWTGDVTAGPMTSSVVAKTYTGNVQVASTGRKVTAENQEGQILLTLSPEPVKQTISISTIRGRVRVVVPETRAVDLDVYARGVAVRSAYNLGGGGARKGDFFEYAGIEKLEKFLGPSGEKIWTALEIYALDDIFAGIEIAKP
jgi:hypothetical protein